MQSETATLMPSTNGQTEFSADTLKCVWIKFVRSIANIDAAGSRFHPEFSHQHFGENESIFGYTDLQVNIYYASSSMFFHPTISYNNRIDALLPNIQPDDIMAKLKLQLPIDDQNFMITNREEFAKILEKEETFRPFGNLISAFSLQKPTVRATINFEVFKVNESSDQFDAYLSRIQSFSMWFIDASQYTETSDARWMHYLIFEKSKSSVGHDCFSFAAYMSVYKFYAYPEHCRPRIAQVMILPPFRRCGLGPKFLQTVYDDLVPLKIVLDITVEDPSDNFINLRDYVDCINCMKLPSFCTGNLCNGFSKDMKNEAKRHLKLCPRQARRVYEILRLKCTNVGNELAFKKYRLDVKQRLNVPFKKNKHDWLKLCRALDDQEMAAGNLNSETRMRDLDKLFDQTIQDYRLIINRLDTYSPHNVYIFQH